MSAREVPAGYQWPELPHEITCRADFKRWIDGYDVAIRYVDEQVGRLLEALEAEGVLDETIVMISADHGENQGELNVYGDHHTADHLTSRVPCIIAGPGIRQGHVDEGFHYQIDLGPTLVELAGGERRDKWDGSSFLPALTHGKAAGRPYLVISQAAWSCQRAVRFEHWILIRTYHAGLKDFPDLMLFDLDKDPHETTDVAAERPDAVGQGIQLLEAWVADQLVTSDYPTDPMWHVIHEGGPFHTRGQFAPYLKRLRKAGRHDAADRLEQRHRKLRRFER
jgi:choline-sulfatase